MVERVDSTKNSETMAVFMYGSVGNKVFNFNRRQMDEPSLLSGSVTNKFTREIGRASCRERV